MPAKKKKGKKEDGGGDGGEGGNEDKEIFKWLADPTVCLQERFDDFDAMGIKVVNDFAVMDEDDLNTLFPEGSKDAGKTKFDRKRFLKALQQAMPQFIVEERAWRVAEGPAAQRAAAAVAAGGADDEATASAPPAAAATAAASDAAGDAGEAGEGEGDELAQALARHLLTDFDGSLRAMGVRTPADVLEMNDDDVRGLRLDKFSRKRFGTLQRELGGAVRPSGGAAAALDGAASAVASSGADVGLVSSAYTRGPTRQGPTPAVSMRQGSRHAQVAIQAALETGAAQREETVTSFYEHWAATNKKPPPSWSGVRRGPTGASGYVPSPNQQQEEYKEGDIADVAAEADVAE